jgi:hypothetical protein
MGIKAEPNEARFEPRACQEMALNFIGSNDRIGAYHRQLLR